jgi:hypothetical protein
MFLLAFAFVLPMFTACNNTLNSVLSGTDQTGSSGTADDTGVAVTEDKAGTVTEAQAENSEDHEDARDYTWDSSKVIQIVLSGNVITVTPAVATVDGSNVTITAAGTYNITGSLTDGQVIVNSDDDANVTLILDGANIKCSSSAPIYIKKAAKTVINLPEGTSNSLTDGTSYSTTDEPSAALFSNSRLTIFGNGSLAVTGNYNDGISTDDGLIIKSGTLSVTSVDDGIRGKDYLIIEDGIITVNSKTNGLKSDNIEDATKGYILIEKGIINITSGGDGIAAETNALISDGDIAITSGGGSNKTVTGDASSKGIKGVVSVIIDGGTFTINSADDAIHSNSNITLNNGTFAIATNDDAVHADASVKINGGTLNVSKCIEGMESLSITVNRGNISIVSSDDGFNATKGNGGEANDGSFLYINGGTIAVNSSRGDGLDSNGSIVMTAGTVIVQGPQSQPEVAMDFNGTFSISGGLLVAAGPNSGNMIQAPGTTSTQYCVKATSSSTFSTSTLIHVQDASGNDIVTFKPVRTAYYVVFSSPNLKSGSTYSLYMGGSSTGTNTNGLYTGGTYSGGTLKNTFTISSKVTNVSF